MMYVGPSDNEVYVYTFEGKEKIRDVDVASLRNGILKMNKSDGSKTFFDFVEVNRMDLGKDVSFARYDDEDDW